MKKVKPMSLFAGMLLSISLLLVAIPGNPTAYSAAVGFVYPIVHPRLLRRLGYRLGGSPVGKRRASSIGYRRHDIAELPAY